MSHSVKGYFFSDNALTKSDNNKIKIHLIHVISTTDTDIYMNKLAHTDTFTLTHTHTTHNSSM